MNMSDKLIEMGLHLGGSRDMARRYPDIIQIDEEKTDWDFSCSSTDIELIDELYRLGFTIKNINGCYRDKSVAFILVLYRENIQIVVRYNVKNYLSFWKKMSGEFYRSYIWKSAPERINYTENNMRNFRKTVTNIIDALYDSERYNSLWNMKRIENK